VPRPQCNSFAAGAAALGAILLTHAPALAAAVRAAPDAAAEAATAAYAAAMQGRKAAALTDVQRLVAALPAERLQAAGESGWELTPQYAVLVRFGLWDELIALERPATDAAGLTAGYLYGRGVALAARGRTEEARAALAELERLGASAAPTVRARANALNAVIGVAAPIVTARIAASEYRVTEAVAALEQAVAAEDRLARDEPPDWFFPARDLLGAELLLAGRAADAERVYREDLRRNPGNGWALRGLAAALHAQRQLRAAAAQMRAFTAAWQAADVRLQSSAFWFGGPDNTRCECEREDAAAH
jgi:tetratricopeptide (TPR) repeat protein